MNIKKYLRKQAEKDVKTLLTEEDKLFIQRLIQKNEEREKQEKTEMQGNKK
ncbi:MAG: hypothetical protein K2L12_07210 [Clostridia bacterium]|nr:hypothetical protein [Clostridia bacterium]